MLPQWHIKDPGHSPKCVRGRLHLNTHTSWTKWSQNGLTVLSRHSVETYQEKKLTHNSSGNIWPWSFLCRQGLNHLTFPQNLRSEEKATTNHSTHNVVPSFAVCVHTVQSFNWWLGVWRCYCCWQVGDGEGRESKLCLWNHPGTDVTGMLARCEKVAGTCAEVTMVTTILMTHSPSVALGSSTECVIRSISLFVAV